MILSIQRLLVAGICLYSTAAMAVPQYFLVGDLADPRCQYATIAQALQAALQNGPALDYVMVANNAGYSGQALQVGAQSVLIQGGYANCNLDPDNAQPWTDIVGNGNDPVIRIEPLAVGSHEVTLSKLRIRGGGRSDANGGGVRVTTGTNAHVGLFIDRTEITGNRAQSGGGLHAGRGGNPQGNFNITLSPGTRIHANTATSNGGGVNVWGGNTFIASDQVRIDNNTAAGAGGGLSATAGSFVWVGNPDLSPSRNDVTGARIEQNTAGTLGGGIYLSCNASSIEAHELIVDGNRAQTGGGGIAVTNEANLRLLRDYSNAFGWYCPPALDCTRISNNQVGDGITTGANGGALALYGIATAELFQTVVRDNRSQDGSAIFIDGDGTLRTEGTVFTGNLSYDRLSQASAVVRTRFVAPSFPPELRINFSTFVGNSRRATDNTLKPAIDIVGQQDTSLLLVSSAIFDAGVTMYGPWGSDCVVAGMNAGISSNGTNFRLSHTDRDYAAIFLTPGRNDWRPRFDSPLTDICDTLNAVPQYRDRDLQPRCRDDIKANRWGTCDIGAWENDQLFANGAD